MSMVARALPLLRNARKAATADQGFLLKFPTARHQGTMLDRTAQSMSWIKGQVKPIGEAGIAVTDWGLTHSDITYDVVPVWDGSFFRLDDYIARFRASMDSLRMDIGMDDAAIAAALHDMVGASGLREGYTSMVASRGSPAVPGVRDPRLCINHFYAWVVPYVNVIQPDVVAAGASAHIPTSIRRVPPECINPLIKSYHWGDLTAGLFEAKENGAETVFLLDQKDNITEGPGLNVFAVKNRALITPDAGCLHGITRRTVLDIAAESGIDVSIRPIPLEEFMRSDEVFITSSAGGVMPITKVNDHVFCQGSWGPLTTSIRTSYWAMVHRADMRTDIRYSH